VAVALQSFHAIIEPPLPPPTECETMTISFELPQDIEEQVCSNGADLSQLAREAFLVELYRERKITQHQLGQALKLDDYETDGVLKR